MFYLIIVVNLLLFLTYKLSLMYVWEKHRFGTNCSCSHPLGDLGIGVLECIPGR
jgi:hypothetical protein